MRNKVYIIILVTCLFSCGLPYNKKTQFDTNDLLWLNAYNSGDTIYFSNNKDIDTLIITNKTINNPRNTFIFDLENNDWMEGNHKYYANADYEYKLYHNEVFDGILMVMQKIPEQKSAIISFSFGGWYSNELLLDNITSYIINNKKYEDCIIVNYTNSHPGKYQKILDLDFLIWCKSKGLISYKLKDEDIYIKKDLY